MTQNVVQLVRDMQASRNAVATYRAAARRHQEMGLALLRSGFESWAEECFEFSRRLAIAALAEKLTQSEP